MSGGNRIRDTSLRLRDVRFLSCAKPSGSLYKQLTKLKNDFINYDHNLYSKREVKPLHRSQVAHQARAYPCFCSMKWLAVFLLSPEWDTSQSQAGLPPALSSLVPARCPWPGLEPRLLNPKMIALIIRPPCRQKQEGSTIIFNLTFLADLVLHNFLQSRNYVTT